MLAPDDNSEPPRSLYRDRVDEEIENCEQDTEVLFVTPATGSSSRRRRYLILIVGAIILVGVGVSIGVTLAAGGGGGGVHGTSQPQPLSTTSHTGPPSTPTTPPDRSRLSPPAGPPSPIPPNNGSNPGPTSTSNTQNTAVESLLRSASPTGGTEFDDPTSYQSKALRWIEAAPYTVRDTIGAVDRLKQRFALACIYYATYNQENPWTQRFQAAVVNSTWLTSTGWLVDPDECAWYGITCNSEGLVETIDLSDNLLTGQFPAEVTYLKESLRFLYLENAYSYNRGQEGNVFLGELTMLEDLVLRNTLFQYPGIPTEMAQLTRLRRWDASYSLYYGPIPDVVFANMTQLEFLDISGNLFNCTLPSSLGRLPSLKYMYAMEAEITGSLHEVLANQYAHMLEFWVDSNPQLVGSIPKTGLTPSLESLSISRCSLTGTIPTTLGLLSNMIQMWLYDNKLRGTIPTELGSLTHLRYLSLQGNNLNGTMPQAVCSIKSPLGRLEKLSADCGVGKQITCSCCDCCGDGCDY